MEKVVNKILEAEVAEKLQARPYERSEDRRDTATATGTGHEVRERRCVPAGNRRIIGI